MTCFLDIDNAYNNVENTVLISTLDSLKVGRKVCTYLWHLLEDRNFKIQLEDILMAAVHTRRETLVESLGR